jgi:four helix bundle protein
MGDGGGGLDHERLEVYRESIRFVAWVSELLESRADCGRIRDQLDRSAASVPLNIAEGNGKRTGKDRCHYLAIAHGSALESAASLDVLVARGKATRAEADAGKELLLRIVKMLVGLSRSNQGRE